MIGSHTSIKDWVHDRLSHTNINMRRLSHTNIKDYTYTLTGFLFREGPVSSSSVKKLMKGGL